MLASFPLITLHFGIPRFVMHGELPNPEHNTHGAQETKAGLRARCST